MHNLGGSCGHHAVAARLERLLLRRGLMISWETLQDEDVGSQGLGFGI